MAVLEFPSRIRLIFFVHLLCHISLIISRWKITLFRFESFPRFSAIFSLNFSNRARQMSALIVWLFDSNWKKRIHTERRIFNSVNTVSQFLAMVLLMDTNFVLFGDYYIKPTFHPWSRCVSKNDLFFYPVQTIFLITL